MASKETNKVDACIIDNGMEICLLETSGKLLLRDNTKYGFDHIKCNFGSLNIFNNIYKKYYWASQETAGRLKIPFVHARHDTIHLWSLELCSPKLYCSKKVFKCVVPKATSETNNILALGNVCWCLTSALRDAAETIQAMKNEHNPFIFWEVTYIFWSLISESLKSGYHCTHRFQLYIKNEVFQYINTQEL
ncbi:hypothetical protein PS15m_007093 [Mucor circinelloides]